MQSDQASPAQTTYFDGVHLQKDQSNLCLIKQDVKSSPRLKPS